MADVKLSLKFGALEVECQGSEDFVGTHLIELIERVSRVELPDVVVLEAPSGEEAAPAVAAGGPSEVVSRLSTTDFAVKIGAKSGSDLVMAAAAYLHHTRGMEEFRRSDLLNEMKAAKAFYRASYGSNLSKSLDMLTKTGRLQNPRADTYALPYSEIENTKRLL